MDFDTIRRWLNEAEAIEVPREPPAAYGDPVGEKETVIRLAPMTAQRLYTLAQAKADIAVACARLYSFTEDSDGSGLIAIHERSLEIQALEDLAEKLVAIESLRETRGEGSVDVRTGWQVAWDPESESPDDIEE